MAASSYKQYLTRQILSFERNVILLSENPGGGGVLGGDMNVMKERKRGSNGGSFINALKELPVQTQCQSIFLVYYI